MATPVRMALRLAIRQALPVLALLAAWEVAAVGLRIPDYILPPPHRIVLKFGQASGLLWAHTIVSVIEIALGFLAAAMAGFLLAVAIAYSRWVERLVEPFLVVSQVIPKVALAPLFVIWFGHGLMPKVVIAATIAFFPVLVNTILGLKAVDAEVVELMDSIAATKRQVFWKVRLPHSLPYIFPALKVAALLAVVGAMVGEFVGSDKGLGYLMILGDVNLQTDLLFAALAVVTGVGLLLYGAVSLLHRAVLERFGEGDTRQFITL